MAGAFQVTTNSLTNKKSDLFSKNSDLKKKIEELRQAESDLNKSWTGEAQKAFHGNFQSNTEKIDTFTSTMDDYINKLEEIIKLYEMAEQDSIGIANEKAF